MKLTIWTTPNDLKATNRYYFDANISSLFIKHFQLPPLKRAWGNQLTKEEITSFRNYLAELSTSLSAEGTDFSTDINQLDTLLVDGTHWFNPIITLD